MSMHCDVDESIEEDYSLEEPAIGDEEFDPIFTARQTTISEFVDD